jgi:hypothetical protein
MHSSETKKEDDDKREEEQNGPMFSGIRLAGLLVQSFFYLA